MRPKKITVVDACGDESTEAIGSHAGYNSLLNRLRASFLVDEKEGFNVNDFESLEDGGKYTLGPPQQQLQQQQQQQQPQPLRNGSWYLVTGAMSRPRSHAGARYNLFRFASSDGLYPDGCDANTAFETFRSPRDTSKKNSILKFSVVFQSLNAAAKFLDNIGSYLKQSRGMLHFCNNEGNLVGMPPITSITPYPIMPESKILLWHYAPRDSGDVSEAPDSPVIDLVCGSRSMSDDITVDVTILSRRDEVFRYQSIEKSSVFGLADPESAHIFPSSKCVGPYEWLDDKPFNRLALSRDLHLNFDGTGRGRGKRRKTVQTFAIRPLERLDGYSIASINDVDCFEIPLELVLNDNTKAEYILERLKNHAELHRNENKHWTITGADVRLFYPKNRRIELVTEVEQNATNTPRELVTQIPGVTDLCDCWSNCPQNLLSLEAAEILEKCLCWNYHEAVRIWSTLG